MTRKQVEAFRRQVAIWKPQDSENVIVLIDAYREAMEVLRKEHLRHEGLMDLENCDVCKLLHGYEAE